MRQAAVAGGLKPTPTACLWESPQPVSNDLPRANLEAAPHRCRKVSGVFFRRSCRVRSNANQMWCSNMLTAEVEGTRIDAFTAEKGPAYICPQCRRAVTLKKGRIVVHHFAHKPPTTCPWAAGETRDHMKAKILVANAAKLRGLRAELEFVVNTMPGDRRADVMVWSPKGGANRVRTATYFHQTRRN